MQIISQISFDFSSPGITPRIYGKQDDSGSRWVAISLYASGVAFEIPGDALLMLRYTGPTGAIGLYDTTPSGESAFIFDGNTVYCHLVDQIFAAPGRVRAELRLIDSQSSVSTWEFWIDVEGSKTGDAILPTDYINVLTNISAQVASNAAYAAEAAGRAEAAAKVFDPSTFLQYEDYDPTGEVKAAGGMPQFVSDAINALTSHNVEVLTKPFVDGVLTSYVYDKLVIAVCTGTFDGKTWSLSDAPSKKPAYAGYFPAAVFSNSVAANASITLLPDDNAIRVTVKKTENVDETASVCFAYICE